MSLWTKKCLFDSEQVTQISTFKYLDSYHRHSTTQRTGKAQYYARGQIQGISQADKKNQKNKKPPKTKKNPGQKTSQKNPQSLPPPLSPGTRVPHPHTHTATQFMRAGGACSSFQGNCIISSYTDNKYYV